MYVYIYIYIYTSNSNTCYKRPLFFFRQPPAPPAAGAEAPLRDRALYEGIFTGYYRAHIRVYKPRSCTISLPVPAV